jgi:hypothetical protein
LIEQNETLQAGRYSDYEESLNAQIAQDSSLKSNNLQNQITQINQAKIEAQLSLGQSADFTIYRTEISKLDQGACQNIQCISHHSGPHANLAEKQVSA